MQNEYQILLFYKYTEIEDPIAEMGRQRAVASVLGLKGRFIIAHEGVNITCEGTLENTEKYIEWMNSQKKFKNIHWKKSVGDGESFPRLSVKVRPEIVSLHLKKDLDPNNITGKRLKPHDLHQWFNENKDFAIVDMRNDYELKVGQFKNTVFPGMENFRDLNDQIKKIDNLKDKTVLTVCTGGIRCEKASGLLVKEGFRDVYQLDGGMISYMEKYPGENFLGSLYVFDKRKVINFNGDKHEIFGKCEICHKPSEHYINCENTNCHKHLIVCEDCNSISSTCGEKCKREFANIKR